MILLFNQKLNNKAKSTAAILHAKAVIISIDISPKIAVCYQLNIATIARDTTI